MADLLPQHEVWPVLRELANKGEADLRNLCRPHTEAGFGPEEQRSIEKRRQLDVALGSLTRLEIAYQLGLADFSTPEKEKSEILGRLFKSEAFLRYVNYYLYFGIRFLAGRLAPHNSWLKLSPESLRERTFLRDSNNRPFELAIPPEIVYSQTGHHGRNQPAEMKREAEKKFELLIANAVARDPARHWRAHDPVIQALDFLDGAPAAHGEEPEGTARQQAEATCFELWLLGLRPELSEKQRSRFENLAFGLFKWAVSRSELYHSLHPVPEPSSHADAHEAAHAKRDAKPKRPLGGWSVDYPAAARLGLADMYWISRLFRADVSPEATVKYCRRNWLDLLRQNAALLSEKQGGTGSDEEVRQIQEALVKAEEILRSVFDFTCELVQLGVEITNRKEQQAYEHSQLPGEITTTVGWRRAFNEELEEIERERCSRDFRPPPHFPPVTEAEANSGWSRRIRTGEHPCNLIGLAFSGGGIRSATFNLGVLQGLQRLDLLRKIDYLSTVSGGGFIGSWLIGNVCRTRHWLGTQMNWDESIAHLRRYSNYLSPRSGVLSPDTWTMWASWSRNAFLIQLTGAAWLFTLLLAALLLEGLFDRALGWSDVTQYHLPVAGLIAVLCLILALFTLHYNLRDNRAVSGTAYGGGTLRTTRWLQLMAVVPASIAAFLLSSVLWTDAGDCSLLTDKLKRNNTVYDPSYSGILSAGIRLHFWQLLLLLFFVGLCVISFVTLSRFRQVPEMPQTTKERRKLWWRIGHSFWISLFSALVFYLEICGIVRIFLAWGADARYNWYAYVLGPPLVLAGFSISIVIFIGLSGRNSEETIREWWTRFGTWLGIYGVVYLLLTGFAVFGPPWTLRLFQNSGSNHPALISTIKWGSVLSWIGTVFGGLLAGKSSKTSGDRRNSPALEILANVAGLLFIVGAILIAATVLYVLLFNIALDVPFSQLGDYWTSLDAISKAYAISTSHLTWLGAAFGVAFGCGLLFSRYFEINIFGLNQFYRNRLVRCYLGATRWAPGYRKPQPFTKFDGKDDMKLGAVLKPSNGTTDGMPFRGPFPIYNCTLNLAGSSDLSLHTRHSASFSLTPQRCGADREKVGYAPTLADESGFADGVALGQAVAISGAAASPNMGYNTSPLVAFLLTMFNVRLGWWFPNPSQGKWKNPGLNFSLMYLMQELFGVADENSNYVNVSDGGHFENLGIYELVRRGCKVIIAGDAECDESLQFGSLGNVIRLCETDFGAKIDINVDSIRPQQSGYSLSHCTVGKITYCNGSIGYLIYLKSSVTGDEEVDIAQYRSIHPSFPHETTADQFFTEDQFESYRQLGLHVVQHSFRGVQGADHPVEFAEKLFDVLTPAGNSETFLKHIKTLDDIWERLRKDVKLRAFVDELEGIASPQPGPVTLSHDEALIGLEIIQLMENVFLDLRLDDFWDHPDNRGWAVLFMRWAGSRKLRAVWEKWRSTFGIRFEFFCDTRLGLPRDKYPVRA